MVAISPDLHEFRPPPPPASEASARAAPQLEPDFRALYAEHVDQVWRGLRALGLREASLEDAVQDVFLVVHRRLAAFEARSSFRTWLFGVMLHVARNHRRTEQRKGGNAPLSLAPDVADGAPGPYEDAAAAEDLRRLARLLGALDAPRREVFVLTELEQMSAPEIADALQINVNTVYSRLRAARRAFEVAVAGEEGNRR